MGVFLGVCFWGVGVGVKAFWCVFATVIVLSAQLRMFDLNGDGKLGLSEMARWGYLHAFLSYILFCLGVHSQARLQSCWPEGVFPVVLSQTLASTWKFPAEVWGKIRIRLILLYQLKLQSCNTHVHPELYCSALLDYPQMDCRHQCHAFA